MTSPRKGRRGETGPHRAGTLRPSAGRLLWGTAALLLGTAPALRADQVVVGGENYPGAKVETLEHGQLQFRTIEGKRRSVWLSDVDTLIIDDRGMFADFNQAERYLADGRPEQAVVRYRRTLRRSPDLWTELITARLVTACDRAGRLDDACRNFALTVRAERTGPALAVRLMPQRIPDERTEMSAAAIEHLDAAVASEQAPERRVPLELLRYEILRRTGDERSAAMAPRIVALAVPAALHTEATCAIVAAALEHAATEQVSEDVLSGLDRAIRDCPKAALPDLLLLKGNILLHAVAAREDLIRAGWPFMRVAIHMPDDPRAAEGLYGAARVMEQIGRADQAIRLLEECQAHRFLTDETRELARTALARLQAGGAVGP